MVLSHSSVLPAVVTVVTVVTAAAVAACASPSTSGAGAAPTPAPIIVTDERDAALSAALGRRVVSDDPTIGEPFAAPSAQVYQAIVVAFGELGVPATVVNPSGGVVASIDRRATGRLGDSVLSRYLSCGESMTGPRANQDRIVLSLVSRVKPDGANASRVETRLVATASGMTGTSDRMPCTTTGELESRVHKAAKTALGLSP